MVCLVNQLTGFCLIGAFTERCFQAVFFILVNKITVTNKTTLNNRKNVYVQILYTIFLTKNQCYLQLFSNIEEFVCWHNRQQWPTFDGYNPSIFYTVFGEDLRQYF